MAPGDLMSGHLCPRFSSKQEETIQKCHGGGAGTWALLATPQPRDMGEHLQVLQVTKDEVLPGWSFAQPTSNLGANPTYPGSLW